LGSNDEGSVTHSACLRLFEYHLQGAFSLIAWSGQKKFELGEELENRSDTSRSYIAHFTPKKAHIALYLASILGVLYIISIY
jgi:hypothetical protein